MRSVIWKPSMDLCPLAKHAGHAEMRDSQSMMDKLFPTQLAETVSTETQTRFTLKS